MLRVATTGTWSVAPARAEMKAYPVRVLVFLLTRILSILLLPDALDQ